MKSIRLHKRISLKRGVVQWLLCLLVLFSFTFLFVNPVLAQPVITTSPLLPQGQMGTPYYAALQAAGGTPPYTGSIISGGLPTGLNFAATGIISGTPSLAGTFNFTAQVTDSTAATASQAFVITITQPPLKFLTTTLAVAEELKAYTDRSTVSGGTTPYTWSISSGSLPSGITLNPATGFFSGIPAKGTVGSYSFMVSVSDRSPTPITGQQSFSITVEKGGYKAIITIDTGLKLGETKVYVAGSPIATLRGGESTPLSLDVGVR